jgi:hypothetical protein
VLQKQRDQRDLPVPLDLAAWALLLGCRRGDPLARLLAQTPSAAEHLTPLITLDLLVDLELMP